MRTTQPPAAGDPRAMELAHLKMLGRALKLHADEHDGKFPSAIAEIDWRQNLPGMDWAGLPAAVSRFHHPETGRVSDWLYYPGPHGERSAGNDPGRRRPWRWARAKDRRMVVRVNGVAEVIAEADFQRQMPRVAEPAPARLQPVALPRLQERVHQHRQFLAVAAFEDRADRARALSAPIAQRRKFLRAAGAGPSAGRPRRRRNPR